jgi:hypothetical protein
MKMWHAPEEKHWIQASAGFLQTIAADTVLANLSVWDLER